MSKTFLAFLKTLSAVLANLSAGWFGLAIVTPNFSSLFSQETIILLTKDISFGIVFLIAATLIERRL